MQDTKLAYLLTRIGMDPDKRTELCRALGISERTFYLRRNSPGSLTLDEAASLNTYLERTTGQPQDVFKLYQEKVDLSVNA
jgi:hypothetical protein